MSEVRRDTPSNRWYHDGVGTICDGTSDITIEIDGLMEGNYKAFYEEIVRRLNAAPSEISAPTFLGPCSCADGGKCKHNEQGPLCMQAAAPSAIGETRFWVSVDDAMPVRGDIVLVQGGTAMYMDGVWYSGMEEPLFRRAIQWPVKFWRQLPEAPQ